MVQEVSLIPFLGRFVAFFIRSQAYFKSEKKSNTELKLQSASEILANHFIAYKRLSLQGLLFGFKDERQ